MRLQATLNLLCLKYLLSQINMKKKQKVPRCEMLWLDRSLSQIAYLLFILEETKKSLNM